MSVRVASGFDVINFVSEIRKAFSGDENGAPGITGAGFENKGLAFGISNTGLGADHFQRYVMPNFNTATVALNVRRKRITGAGPGFTYSSPHFIQFQDEFEVPMVCIRLEPDGSITLTNGDGTVLFHNTSVFIPYSDFGAGDYDYAHLTLRVTTPNGLELYDHLIPIYSDFVWSTGSLPIRYICITHNQFGGDAVQLDNFVCTDTEVFGQMYVHTSLPVQDISNSGWIRVGASSYNAAVNESVSANPFLSVNYADYIRSSTGGAKVIWHFRNVPPLNDIKAVCITAIAVSTDPTTSVPAELVVVMKRDGVEQSAFPMEVATRAVITDGDDHSARGVQFVMETDPYTGLAWQPADINLTEFGLTLFTPPDAGHTRVFQVHREIVCVALTGGYGGALEEWSMHTPAWMKG